MKKTAKVKRFLSLLAAITLLATLLSAYGFSASAEAKEHIVVTIDNATQRTAAENPLIQIYTKKAKGFKDGTGPYTVRFEWKVEIGRVLDPNDNCSALVNFLSLESPSTNTDGMSKEEKEKVEAQWSPFGQVSINKSTNGWVDVIAKNGKYIELPEFTGVMDGKLEKYGLLRIGLYNCKGTLAIRNFRILNKSGQVIYSLDADPDVNKLLQDAQSKGQENCLLSDIGAVNPTPDILFTGFGQHHTAKCYVSKASSDDVQTPATTKGGPVFEEPTAAPKTTAPVKTPTAGPKTTAGKGTPTATKGTTVTGGTVVTVTETEDTQSTETETTAVSDETAAATTAVPVGGGTTAPTEQTGGGLPAWAIVLIVLGGIVVVGGGVLLYLYLAKKPPFNKP